MNQTEKIDRILEAAGARLQSEIEGLLATDFILEPAGNVITDKSRAFSDLKGKQICTRLEFTGEIPGTGCLLVGIKDAIRLAGTLIMLPVSELDEVIGREEYSEEIEDSYVEIGNIIAAAFSSDFEEMYSKSCILIPKDQAIIVPKEVDTVASQPVENQAYYQAAFTMTLDGRTMGNLVMLLPAASFELELDSEGKPASTETIAQPQIEAEKELETDSVGEIKSSSTKPRQLIDRILEESRKRLESELGALVGIEVMLIDLENRTMDKNQFFSEIVHTRQVFANLEVTGDSQDVSYFAISARDAIYLGGTLIMLPPSELDDVVNEGEFSEDARDAYGEIANIIAGVYNAVFEEHHVYKLRFVKKEVRDFDPGQIDLSSDEPISDRRYYISSMSLVAEGKPLGQMHMLIPAEVLQLHEDTSSAKQGRKEQGGEPQEDLINESEKTTQTTSEIDRHDSVSAPTGSNTGVVSEDTRKRVDKVLAQCQEYMADEVSALLGQEIRFNDLKNLVVSKEDFFAGQTVEEQVIVNFNILGDKEGEGYLLVDVSDAIRIGGVLIMLPETELEIAVIEKNFSIDTIDSYGEIANIISAAYSTVFASNFNKKYRFVKTDLKQINPEEVDVDDDKPMPNQHYYLSTMNIFLEEKPLGRLNMLFPLDVLELGGLAVTDSEMQEHQEADALSGGTLRGQQHGGTAALDILLVSDDNVEAEKILMVLREAGYVVKSISTKENIQNYISGQLKAVYLVLKEVNERAFGMAIQVSSSSSLPIIAAGPRWTRSKVIKAVKYGVHDILLTPASKQDIQESVANNIMQLAA